MLLRHEPRCIHAVCAIRDTGSIAIGLHERLIERAPHRDMVGKVCVEATVPVAGAGSQVLSEPSVGGWVFFVLL